MPVAEVAEALFATVDANAIIQCGTAIQAMSDLYGALGSCLDTAGQTLFSGDNAWSGKAAGSAQGGMSDLSTNNATIQSSLSQIGQTLVEYGTAMQPFQKKVYPTPVEGSRDPEAAADLAIVGLASTVAAAKIGTAVVKMAPIAKKSGGGGGDLTPATHPSPGSTLAGFNGGPGAHAHLSGLSPTSGLGTGAFGSGPFGAGGPLGADPFLTNGIIGGAPFAPAEAETAASAAAAGEHAPMTPMAGMRPEDDESERSATLDLAEDDDVTTPDVTPVAAGTVIGA